MSKLTEETGIVIIRVSEAQKRRARKFSLDVVNETYDRFNYSRRARIEKIAWGKLGEEVLAKFFSENGIDCEIDYKIYLGSENTDETDFIVNGYKIDLKVGTKDYHKRLLIVKQYFDNGFFHGDPHPGNVGVKDGKLVYYMIHILDINKYHM